MCLAVPGKILAIQGGEGLWRTGRIDFGGVVKEVNLACVPEVVTGDHVIVHAGVAISRLDEQEAARMLEALRTMGELQEDDAGRGTG